MSTFQSTPRRSLDSSESDDPQYSPVFLDISQRSIDNINAIVAEEYEDVTSADANESDGSPLSTPTSPTSPPRGILLAAERDSAYEGLESADAIYAEPDDSPYSPTSPTSPPLDFSRLSINNDDDDVDPDGRFRSYLKRMRSPTPPRSQTFSDESFTDDEVVTGFEVIHEPADPLEKTTYYDLFKPDEDLVELMKKIYTDWLAGNILDENGNKRSNIKFKIQIGGVDFYIIFFYHQDPANPSFRKTMARIFLNDTKNPLDGNYIISCEIKDDEVYLAHFFYTSTQKQAKEVKPLPTDFMKNLLQRYFEIPKEKIDAIVFTGFQMNLHSIFEKVNTIRAELQKRPITPLHFYYVVDITKHFPSTGQRGMRLVKLIKEITEKPAVTLYDAWKGQWGETSEDLKFIHEYLTKRNAFIEAIRNMDTDPKVIATSLTKYSDARDEWENFMRSPTGPTILLTPKLLQHYEKRFQTEFGKFMIDGGYYGQFGFQPRYSGDRNNLISPMESGDVTQLEFREFSDVDSFTELKAVQSRFYAR